jgi:4-diphosphocytidyl-2-C-methyl-D-erythritol kinase
VRCLAPAKVNLALILGPTRPGDGRHELVTVFQALALADEVELHTLESGPDQVVCPDVPGENLAWRAIVALRERGWDGPPVLIRITKRIPVAAGMAGGSADAAAALRLAMAIAPGRAEEVATIAATLGADVPSQLAPGLSLGTGAGELVEPYPPLGEHAFVVVPSPHALSTPAVFAEADRLGLPRGAAELEQFRERLDAALRGGEKILPPDLVVNDLQPAAISLCPSIAAVLAELRESGADQALVSGSGPTAVGIWWGPRAQQRADAAAAALRARHPRALAVTPVTAEFAAAEPV